MQRVHLAVANDYGSIDVQDSCPKGHVHIRGKRLQPLCRRLGVKYAAALVGFREYRGQYSPILDGVVVTERSAPKVRQAIAEREERARKRTPAKRMGERVRKERRDAAEFLGCIKEQFPGCPEPEAERVAAHACTTASGRVGRTRTLDLWERVRRAVVAHVRHHHTDYDSLLAGRLGEESRLAARDAVADRVRSVLERWQQPMPSDPTSHRGPSDGVWEPSQEALEAWAGYHGHANWDAFLATDPPACRLTQVMVTTANMEHILQQEGWTWEECHDWLRSMEGPSEDRNPIT